MPKATERYKKIRENLKQQEIATEEESFNFNHKIHDVVKTPDNKYEVIEIKYDSENLVAEVVSTGKVYDSASRADYNCNELNVAERVARLRNNNG